MHRFWNWNAGWVIKLGLAWGYNKQQIPAGIYFKYLQSKYDSYMRIPGDSDVEYLEERIIDSGESIHMSHNKELLSIRELQKDAILNDLNFVVAQCFAGKKYLKPPKSEDLVAKEMLDLADRIVNIRQKLL